MRDGERCPICGIIFIDDRCPHSIAEAEERKKQNKMDLRVNKLIDARVNKLIDARLEKYGLVKFK